MGILRAGFSLQPTAALATLLAWVDNRCGESGWERARGSGGLFLLFSPLGDTGFLTILKDLPLDYQRGLFLGAALIPNSKYHTGS